MVPCPPALLLNVFLVPITDPCLPQHPVPFTPKSGFLFLILQLDPSPVPSQLRGLYQFSGSGWVPTWYASARRGVRRRTDKQLSWDSGQIGRFQEVVLVRPITTSAAPYLLPYGQLEMFPEP